MVHGLHDVELFHELILSQTMSEPLLAEALDDHLVGAVVDVGQHALLDNQVWSLTQFYSVDISKSRIGVKKCVCNKRTIKVCDSCY